MTFPLVTSMAVTGASFTVLPRLQLLSVGWATNRRPSRTNLASSWAHSSTSTAIWLNKKTHNDKYSFFTEHSTRVRHEEYSKDNTHLSQFYVYHVLFTVRPPAVLYYWNSSPEFRRRHVFGFLLINSH